MKKLYVLFLAIFVFSGCSNEEMVISSSNGESLTYNFFEDLKYSGDDYTLRLKNDEQVITIIKTGDKRFYKVQKGTDCTKIIEMNGYKYTINNDHYTTEEITVLDDYAADYLPSSLETLKTQGYKTGKERIGIWNYTYEAYQNSDVITKYYFRGSELKYIRKEKALEENLVSFVSLKNEVDESKFKLPEDKIEITY